MNRKRNWWERHAITSILLAAAIVGLILLYYGDDIGGWSDTAKTLTDGIGVALITASILGLTVDRLLKQQILRNVFKTAFGYILPEGLKPAARWLYSQKLMWTNVHVEYKWKPLPGHSDAILLYMRIRRTLQNVTDKKASTSLGLLIPVIGIEPYQVQICEFSYKLGGNEKVDISADESSICRSSSRVWISPEHCLTLQPNDKLETLVRYQIVTRPNDHHIFRSRYAMQNPEFTIDCQVPEMEVDLPSVAPEKEFGRLVRLGASLWKIDATLLPDQAIELRWYPKDDVHSDDDE